MPKDQELSAKLSSKGQVVIPADVRRLKGRITNSADRVSVADMNLAAAEQRAIIARRLP